MPFRELDDLLRDKRQVTHVSETHFARCFCIVASLLAIDDTSRDISGFEDINGKLAIVAALHRSIEYLLHHVVDDVVKKVVPRESEEKVLDESVRGEPNFMSITYKDSRDNIVLHKLYLQIVSDDWCILVLCDAKRHM